MSGIPERWVCRQISEIANTTSGGTPSRKNPDFFTGDIAWIKSGNLNDGLVTAADEFITESALASSSAKIFPTGTLLIALYGATIGKLGILGVEAATNQAVCGMFVSDIVDNKFLFYYLLKQRRELIKLGAGGAQPNISQKIVRDIQVPLPPLPEQHRIVARIEELFSRLDAGVVSLRHAKAQLKRYRQSVLTAAVTGQLTAHWREQNPETEPASELLERILKKRREEWKGKGKYKEPAAPDVEGLPALPPSWTWSTVAQQSDSGERAITDGPFGSKLKTSHYTDSGPRVIRLQNVGDGVFKDEYAHIPEKYFRSLSNHQVFAGDLVIRSLGIPPHQTCQIPHSVGPAIVKADCIRFKVFEPHINPRFTLYALNSHPVRIRSEKHMHGVGRPRLNGVEVKHITLPLPPLAEQHQIVAEVEARTTAIDHLEVELDRQLTRANRLRQSILASAFQGRPF